MEPLEDQTDEELLEGIYARNRILEARRQAREGLDALKAQRAELDAQILAAEASGDPTETLDALADGQPPA